MIEQIRLQSPGTRVEVLTPDFQGNEQALRMVAAARPEILNHNIETVPRLYGIAKSGGRYNRSLEFLGPRKKNRNESGHAQVTKTGIIVGLGEEMHELLAASSATSPTARSTSSPSGNISAPAATTS